MNKNKNQQAGTSDSRKMSKLEKENEKLKSLVAELKEQRKQAETELRKERKKKPEGNQADRRATTITFEAVKRYTYSGFMMMTAVMLCVYAGFTPRKAARSLEVFNHMLHGLLGVTPSHITIRTWLAKMGLDAIKERGRNPEEAYAVIMDASISVGDQQMLLALKVPADHGGKALTHSDEEVVGMAVSESWPAKKVQEFCREMEFRM